MAFIVCRRDLKHLLLWPRPSCIIIIMIDMVIIIITIIDMVIIIIIIRYGYYGHGPPLDHAPGADATLDKLL